MKKGKEDNSFSYRRPFVLQINHKKKFKNVIKVFDLFILKSKYNYILNLPRNLDLLT